MRSIVYGILLGFLLIVSCLFPVAVSAQGLSEASVKYADSVAVSIEQMLTKQGYEPDGQRIAIQVSIALRYRMFKGEKVDAPIQVLAIKEGDPMTLIVSKESPKPDKVASVDSSKAMTASPLENEKIAASDPSIDESERVGKKIGEYLSTRGYTGVLASIDSQATEYLKTHAAAEGIPEQVVVPIKVIQDGRLMTIKVSAEKIEHGLLDEPQTVKTGTYRKQLVASRIYDRKVAHTKKIRSSRKSGCRIATVKTGKATKKVNGSVATAQLRFSALKGNHAVFPMAPQDINMRSWYGLLTRQEGVGKSVFAGSPFKDNLLRLLSSRRIDIHGNDLSRKKQVIRPPNSGIRVIRSEILRN
ncbi:MAG: hypothetical protein HGA31_05610 [Candidatus Moranbacteria bacterium]|nr:hypothetical protein [Candidatus Moranbacteria bacterium]